MSQTLYTITRKKPDSTVVLGRGLVSIHSICTVHCLAFRLMLVAMKFSMSFRIWYEHTTQLALAGDEIHLYVGAGYEPSDKDILVMG